MKKIVLYSLSGCIILFAILVIVSRIFISVLDNHRSEIETWASDLLKMPVTIQSIHVSWYQYQPDLSLRAVTVFNKDTKEPILAIREVKLLFSLFRSAWQRKLVLSGVMIAGSSIHINEHANNEVMIQGFPISED